MRVRVVLFALLVVSIFVVGVQVSARGGKLETGAGEAQPIVLSKLHPVASEIYEIAFEDNFVWMATVNGAVRWNKVDGSQRRFTTAEGLAANHVLTIFVESNGVKWFGTVDGLTRYDGSTWTTYTTAHGLPSNAVRVMERHPDGALLVGTAKGIARFDGATFSQLPLDGVDSDSSGDRMISDIVVHDNVIWIATENAGTYRYRNGNWLRSYGNPETGPGGMVREMALAPDGGIWFAFDCEFQYGSVGHMLDGVWTRFSKADGLISDSTYTIAIAPNGLVHAGFGPGCSGDLSGIGRFVGTGWASFFLDAPAGIPNRTPVNDLKFDAQGTLWAAVYDLLASYDGSEWRVHVMGPPRSAASPGAMGADNDGNMWFGVQGLGAVRYDGQGWRLYTGRDGMSTGTVDDIEVDARGDVWFATSNQGRGTGVRRFDGEAWRSYSDDSGLGSSFVRAISADDIRNVWFATVNGLARYNGASWRRFTSDNGLAANHLLDVAARGGEVWVTYYDGAFGVGHFDGSSWRHYGEAEGLPHSSARLLALDSAGNLWATTGSYLSRFDGTAWTNTPTPGRESYRHIRSLYVDGEDRVWVSIWDDEYTGLTRFEDGEWTTLTMADGLPTDQVYEIAPGALPHQFWMAADREQGMAEVRVLYGLDERTYLPLMMSR